MSMPGQSSNVPDISIDPHVMKCWLGDIWRRAEHGLLTADTYKRGKEWWVYSPLGDLVLRADRRDLSVRFARLMTPTFILEIPDEVRVHLETDTVADHINAIVEWKGDGENHQANFSAHRQHSAGSEPVEALTQFITAVHEITS